MILKTRKVRLYPNSHMRQVLDGLCSYRRYCWNQGLGLWNDMYDAHLLNKDNSLPNHYNILKIMVANKQDWQYSKSSRVLQQSIIDLSEAWKHFFRKDQKDWGKPHFKSKKLTKQGFKSDRIKFIKGKLRLDKPHQVKDHWYDIKVRGELLPYDYGTVSITRINKNKYYATIPYKIDTVADKPKTHKKTAVDVNVGHMNYTNGVINVLPNKLKLYYNRIKHYQKMLARKKPKSRNYHTARTKLQRDYSKVTNLQHDIIHKFTTYLVDHYDKIVIEDLDVKHMKMGIASKGLQRSQFGYFRQVLTYKCAWYGKKLILADRFYPSTQRCSVCGNIKTGDDKITLRGNQKHHTKHNEYVCYNCGSILDRDANAVNNLLALIN